MSNLPNPIVQEARLFAERELRPRATEIDRKEELPRDIIVQMAKRGYLSATFPEEYGGLELDPVSYGFFTEEIGKACCNTRALITVQTSLIGGSLLRWGTKEQKEKWLPAIASAEKLGAFALTEPLVGSNAKAVQLSYRKSGAKYILNGRKKWISFSGIADFFIVIASCEGSVSAFLVDRESEGITVSPMSGLLANRASHIAEIQFDQVEIPCENLLGIEGGGFTYVVTTALDHGRYSIAWAGIGIAAEALEAMVHYSRNRTQFDKKICEHQLIQAMIADAVTELHAARALAVRAGELRGAKSADALMETTIAKYFASKVAMKVATDAVQTHGGNGCYNEYPVERLFREAKVLEIIEGTSQLQQEMIAGYGLRKYYLPKR